MKKETKNWLGMVDYDLITAKQMLETNRYVYVILKKTQEVTKCIKQNPALKG